MENKLAKNVIQNIASNNCYRYNCHGLRAELETIIEEYNGKKLFIYKKLVRHFGRVLSSKKDSFVGELGSESHYSLLHDIEKDLFLQVKQRKKYEKEGKYLLLFLSCSVFSEKLKWNHMKITPSLKCYSYSTYSRGNVFPPRTFIGGKRS